MFTVPACMCSSDLCVACKDDKQTAKTRISLRGFIKYIIIINSLYMV